MDQVFLSYARRDLDRARRLYDQLLAETSKRVWFDQVSLMPGLRWEPAVRRAIRESRYFVALLSRQSVSERGYRQSELRQALEVLAEYPADQVYLLPVRLDDCSMPDPRLDEIHRVDLFPRWRTGLSALLSALESGQAKGQAVRTDSSRSTVYRVALQGLGVEPRVLTEVANGLNAVQDFFTFTTASLPAGARPQARRARQAIDGVPQLWLDAFDEAFFDQSRFLAVDLIACVTDVPLAFTEAGVRHSNYFACARGPQGRFLFLSTDLLADMTALVGQSLSEGVAFLLAGILVSFFTDRDYHEATRECPLDHCAIRTDIAYGLNARRLCPSCARSIRTPGLKRAIDAIMKWRPVRGA